ncbi:enoyl-CoA hydratase-related protein [Castellaniella sp. S9]|uniref:enoyl-CoA hydratase-related protein n=1 Tax=Castellaniella sp. S9 TaxID=2993652 RepID=UPI0022B443BB|nr:enoyl-CoA hydratase-related protein [Castellaniella sp. S9]
MGGQACPDATDGGALVLSDRPAPGILVLTLNRPAKANSLSTELLIQLSDHLAGAQQDDTVACVVLTGSDRVFSAGADISGMVHQGVDWYLGEERLARWAFLQDYPKPLIAAVNGHALGGGCELAMLCDIIIAGTSARFCQAEIGIGVIPGDGGTQRLPRAVGKSLAMQMILTGQPIDAQRALEAGLVSEVTDPADTVARAIQIGAQIAEHPPLSVQLAKRAVKAAFEQPLSDGLLFERARVVDVFGTEDRAEGMRAFLEKRRPRYQGR